MEIREIFKNKTISRSKKKRILFLWFLFEPFEPHLSRTWLARVCSALALPDKYPILELWEYTGESNIHENVYQNGWIWQCIMMRMYIKTDKYTWEYISKRINMTMYYENIWGYMTIYVTVISNYLFIYITIIFIL